MKIVVFPRRIFLNMPKNTLEKIMNSCNIISINTPVYEHRNIVKEDPPFDKKYWKYPNVLIQYYHDCSKTGYNDVIYFNEQMANEIKTFMENRIYNETIVHCTAGISRSGAIGYVLNLYYNYFTNGMKYNDDYKEFEENYADIHIPNVLVKNILMKQFGMNNHWNVVEKEKIDVEKLANEVGLL